jgi:hypothetical protein
MVDDFGITEGAKALSASLDGARDASKKLSKSIEGIQGDAFDVAQRQASERKAAKKKAALLKERAIYKALEEYRHRKVISEKEYQAKVEFIKKYGAKEWEEVLKIKKEIETMEQNSKKFYDEQLKDVRRVQFICFIVAAWIAWYLVWGIKP